MQVSILLFLPPTAKLSNKFQAPLSVSFLTTVLILSPLLKLFSGSVLHRVQIPSFFHLSNIKRICSCVLGTTQSQEMRSAQTCHLPSSHAQPTTVDCWVLSTVHPVLYLGSHHNICSPGWEQVHRYTKQNVVTRGLEQGEMGSCYLIGTEFGFAR